MKEIWKNLKWGVGMGLIMAGFFAAYVSILFLLNGDRLREKYDTTWAAIVLGYLGCGLFGGFILGVLRPFAVWAVGEAIIGFFIGAIFSVMITIALDGFSVWNNPQLMLATALFCGGVGAIIALMARSCGEKLIAERKAQEKKKR